MKRLFLILAVCVFFAIYSLPLYAKSDYVLPYPSSMPGGISYKFHLFCEFFEKYWYFGSFGQFTYNLKKSDKYLVEAKTLFEYKQFLLGHKAFKKSDEYFKYLLSNLNNAKNENKNIITKRKILKEAALKHVEILSDLKKEIPETFLWQPEKSQPIYLYLKKDIEQSISIRVKNL